MACVVSYILISNISWFRELNSATYFINKFPNNPIINSAIAFFIGTIFSIILSIVVSRKCFSKITVSLFHRTLNDDIWHDILDLENGSNLKIFPKDKDYYVIGHHKNHEELGADSWLAISGYALYNKETDMPYKNKEYYLGNLNIIYTIKFSDIEHIEIF